MAIENLVPLPLQPPPRQLLRVSADAPLRIDGGDCGWLVETGRVDLFALALTDGQPSGRRHALCSIAPGGLILTLPDNADYVVIGVGHPDTAVERVTGGGLAGWSADRRAALTEGWVRAIAGAVFPDRPAFAEHVAEPGRAAVLTAGQQLHAARGVAWVSPQSGLLRLGTGNTALSGLAPIAAGMWLRAETDCAVDCFATAEVLERGWDEPGLVLFHRLILAGLGERLAREDRDAQQRVAARAAVDRGSLRMALRHLAGVAVALPPEASPTVAGGPMLSAFAAAAAHNGLSLSRQPRAVGGVEPAIGSLARANGIGLRSVLLREAWWRRDSGALLGWLGEAQQPVALLPKGRRSYRLWDPDAGLSTVVDERVAAELAPRAVMPYRPLPERVAGIAGLAGFAARGTAPELVTILAMGVFAGIVGALLPLAIGYLFGSAVPRSERAQVLVVVAGLVLAALGAGIFDLSKATALLRLEGRLEAALQPALMLRLLGLPANFFRGFGSGDLMNRVLSIQGMRRLLAGNTLVSLLSALFAMISFAVILLNSLLLALLSAGLVGAAAVVSALLALGELRQERGRVALRGQEDALLVQILQGIAKIRVAAGQVRIFAVWAGLFAQQKRRLAAGQRWALAAEAFGEVYPLLALLALFFAASRMLAATAPDEARLSVGGFLSVNAAFGQLLAATMAMARAAATTLELVPLFERLRPILDAAPETRADRTEAAALAGQVELSHVSFRYSEGGPLVLDDVSLRVEPGAFAAVVGPSGSGKSTLLRLLLGFETVESGDILYDGQSIGALDTASLRRQIGVVLQHCRIITGSVFDNITSGLPYTLDDAWAAARLAGLAPDIEAMPMGMHTLLMEGASTLSGGQLQRLMIARALIGRPRVLLFDEATSALDNPSQALVMQSLDRLGATRIVIAHRLSTIERADCIFVLERGRVVEAGDYPELIRAGGTFSRLARRQIL